MHAVSKFALVTVKFCCCRWWWWW